MKASFIREHGGAEKIECGELPKPHAADHQLLVRVRACALNHVDIWVRGGSPAYPVDFPHIMGSDISGEIAEIPGSLRSQYPHLKEGDSVVVAPGVSCWNCPECLSGHDNQCAHFRIIGTVRGLPGGYAEYVAVPARNVLPKPEYLSFEEAASFPLTFLTAWHMLISRAGLKPGETVLILGAGSGIGAAAIQIARCTGAFVIAVSTSQKKLEMAKKIGADQTVHADGEDFSKKVLELTKGQGVHVVFEHVGPATWEKSIRCLAPRGRVVTCGATTGPVVPLDLRVLFSKDSSVLGSRMGTRAELEKVIDLINRKRLNPVVRTVFPLSEAAAAQRFLENKKQFGKVVLKVA